MNHCKNCVHWLDETITARKHPEHPEMGLCNLMESKGEACATPLQKGALAFPDFAFEESRPSIPVDHPIVDHRELSVWTHPYFGCVMWEPDVPCHEGRP